MPSTALIFAKLARPITKPTLALFAVDRFRFGIGQIYHIFRVLPCHPEPQTLAGSNLVTVLVLVQFGQATVIRVAFHGFDLAAALPALLASSMRRK
jgi:hypothetical protein